MGSESKVILTKSELHYLLWLIERNEDEGVYFGSEEAFWRRCKNLKKKFVLAMGGWNVCPNCGKLHYVKTKHGFCSTSCFNSW